MFQLKYTLGACVLIQVHGGGHWSSAVARTTLIPTLYVCIYTKQYVVRREALCIMLLSRRGFQLFRPHFNLNCLAGRRLREQRVLAVPVDGLRHSIPTFSLKPLAIAACPSCVPSSAFIIHASLLLLAFTSL